MHQSCTRQLSRRCHSVCVCIVLVLLLFSTISSYASEKSSFRAAVVEYAPHFLRSNTPVARSEARSIVLGNVANLANFAREASNHSADIIVFPEDALYGPFMPTRDIALPYLEVVPKATESKLICENLEMNKTSPALFSFSCLARELQIYIVANLGSVEWCNSSRIMQGGCPGDGRRQYNTAVAFDRQGRLVARYYKAHLFEEPQWDAGPQTKSNLAYFDTDIGVRFGLLVCFDILFPWPAHVLLQRSISVNALALPSWWDNFQTIITSTQTQQAFSRLNTTLLAAGIGLSFFNSGSGIYQDGNVVASIFNPSTQPLSSIALGDVPIHGYNIEQHTQDLVPVIPTVIGTRQPAKVGIIPPDWNVSTFDAVPGRFHLRASYNTFSCEAVIDVATSAAMIASESDTFGLFAYSGENDTPPLQVCGLTVCARYENASCIGWRLDSHTRIQALSLQANWLDSSFKLPMVASADFELQPPSVLVLGPEHGDWHVTRPISSVLNIAVWSFLPTR